MVADHTVREIEVDEIEVNELAIRLQRDLPPLLIDVRDPDEHAAGCIDGAVLLPLSRLAADIAELAPNQARPVVTCCASGVRSLTAARELQRLGYREVHSLRGGFSAWQRAGRDWQLPGAAQDGAPAALSREQVERYARHVRLPEVGVAGQRRLLDARVLCIGAGGLGSPAALYLAAAGIGQIGLIDDDVVEVSNLQRQVLHTHARIGMPKVDSAEQTLRALNPELRLTKLRLRLGADNALDLLRDWDLVIDGSDNFATRYQANDAALQLRKPVVHAAIQRFEGQLSVFAADGRPCYRCLFPRPPPADAAPSCAEAGVLGVLPGVMGVLQATEAIKLVLGLGESLVGRLLVFDALSMRFSELRLRPDPDCPACGERRS